MHHTVLVCNECFLIQSAPEFIANNYVYFQLNMGIPKITFDSRGKVQVCRLLGKTISLSQCNAWDDWKLWCPFDEDFSLGLSFRYRVEDLCPEGIFDKF